MSIRKVTDQQIHEIEQALKPFLSKTQTDERRSQVEEVNRRFGNVFCKDRIGDLTEEDFVEFTKFSINHRWNGIHRHNGKILKNFSKLKKALTILVDESKPISERLDYLRPPGGGTVVPGLGRSVFTAILAVCYPDKYPVWNQKLDKCLVRFGITFPTSARHAERYVEITRFSLEVCRKLNCSLADYDLMWHLYITESDLELHLDKGGRIFKISPGAKAFDFENQKRLGRAAIGWSKAGSLDDYDEVSKAAEVEVAKGGGKSVSYITEQFNYIRNEFSDGDLILYYGDKSIIEVGRISGGYRFDPEQEYPHFRPVKFLGLKNSVKISDDESLREFFYNTNTIRELGAEDLKAKVVARLRTAGLEIGLIGENRGEPMKKTKSNGEFKGFKMDAFTLLKKYEKNPTFETHESLKEDYKTYLRDPARRLFASVADPVKEKFGDKVETNNRILSIIPKNDYGKGGIHHHYWGAFYFTEVKRTMSPQLFVGLYPDKLAFGFGFGHKSFKYRTRLLERIEGDETLDDSYWGELSEKGLQLRVHSDSSWEKVNYEGEFDLKRFKDALADKKSSTSLAISLRPEEVVELADKLGAQVRTIFSTLIPLFALASFDETQPILANWTARDSGGQDEDVITEASIPWSDLLFDLHWKESDREAIQVKRLTSDFISGEGRNQSQIVLYGPPGTGKTLAAQKIADHVATSKSNIRRVQFHQSYGYEQFIEGIWPEAADGGLIYKRKAGVFVEFCERARKRPDEKFVFLIDEINRGNTSQIFGELLYLLEYRNEKMPLLYSRLEFSIPVNVFIVATMNSADRSLALVDYALRRRFKFVEFRPSKAVIESYYDSSNEEHRRCLDVFESLNAKISDRRLAIGHSYLLRPEWKDIGLTKERFREVWDTALYPLLEEYFAGHPNKLAEFEIDSVWKSNSEKKAA